jgi:hypothetical protein
VSSNSRIRIATAALILIWIGLVVNLMIADVWDETTGMLAFSDPSHPLGWKLHFVLTQSLGFWRPIPTLVVATVLHFVRDFNLSWRLLRGIDILLLLGALVLMLDAIRRWSGPSPWRDLAFTVAFLFSSSTIITAGWYANIFDASALLLIAAGLSLLARSRPLAAGVVLGTAFFCKETAALALPFLVLLFAAGRTSARDMLRTGIPAAILGAVYFAIRAHIVPFGSASDVHGFDPHLLAPTIVNWCESFWRQTMKASGPAIIGFLFLALSLAALRRPRLIAAAALFVLIAGCLYWGMFTQYQNGQLMSHLDLVGRLYLIPASLMLVILSIEAQTLAIALLLMPIVFGAATTYRDHARFQRVYKRIYATARSAGHKPLTIEFPEKPLHDTVRGIEVGEIPGAAVILDPKNGRLKFR